MKLRAKVVRATGTTTHSVHPAIEGAGGVFRLPPAVSLEIEANQGGGFFLLRYDAKGVFAGDTWHETIDEAKVQAEFEYAVATSDWEEVIVHAT